MAAPPEAGPPPPAPPPPPPITDVVITSSQVVSSLYLSLVGGALFLIAWAAVRGPLRGIYMKRFQVSDLPARPPPLNLAGLWRRCFGYIAPVLFITDLELMHTAGLDALVLCRFVELGVQLFVPMTALCCAVLLPLCLSGDSIEDNPADANVAAVMKWTLSNIEDHSPKLWVPFALSYLVLGFAGWTMWLHYRSYALLRLYYLRFGVQTAAGGPPMQEIVGFKPRGWRHARHTLLRLVSPWHMHRSDIYLVRRATAQRAEEEAEQAAAAAAATEALDPGNKAAAAELEASAAAAAAAAVQGAGDEAEAAVLLPPSRAGDDETRGTAHAATEGDDEFADCAVLPWWLPPERIPAEVSAESGSRGVVSGRTCVTSRTLVLATTPAGQAVWAPASQYAVLYTVAGPPATWELQRMLRQQPAAPATPDIKVHAEPSSSGSSSYHQSLGYESDDAAQGRSTALCPRLSRHGPDSQAPGPGAEAVAAQLEGALRALFPSSFSCLVRVYNHKKVDQLLSKHEEVSSQRDRCAGAAAAAAAALLEAEGGGGEAQPSAAATATGKAAQGAGSSSGKAGGNAAAKAAARLAKAEAALAKWQAKTEALEAAIVAAREAALKRPLGTAFIALFRTQAAPAMLTQAETSGAILPSGNFAVRPCPGPDSINWSALWSRWQSVWLRAVLVVPLLAAVILFPIGAFTGALSNLNLSLCGGTPETNSMYWGWYCEATDFWEGVVKELIQGVAPSIISTMWDTYALPLLFYYLAQAERRHFALSCLDHRITELFYWFAVFNTFLGVVFGGSLFQQLGAIIKNPEKWLQMLGTALPSASVFFINYAIIHGLCINLFRFIWPHDGTVLFVLFRAVGLFRPKCERDHYMIRSPPSYRPARHYGSFLLLQIMGLSYAVIAPLVLPAVAVFFLTAWVAWRYSALYFYERSYESGGRIFALLFDLMVGTLTLSSIFTGLVLASKKMWAACLVLLATQPAALWVFHSRVRLAVGHYTRRPLQASLAAPRAEVDPAIFMPPPLRPRSVGWYPEWNKVWEKYGIGRYTW